MPSSFNTQTQTISGQGPAQALPGGMQDTKYNIHTLSARVSTQFDNASDTTLSNIPGLSVNVEAGATYVFRAYLPGTATVNGGFKFAIAGTCTATSVSYACKHYNAATLNANTIATSLGTAVGAATAVFTYAEITGTIVVNAAGTLTVQAAQNASSADVSSIYVNSNFIVERIA